MQIIVNDLLVHYEQVGKGPVVVMLHGWGDTSATFRDLLGQLKGGYSLIALDLPGFGKTAPPPKVWNLDNYAEFVQAFLRKLGTDQPHAIIGHSNGGALAIRGLATDVLHADKLVLLASAGIRDRQKARRVMLKAIAKVGKVATFWLPIQHRKSLQKWLYGAAGSDLLLAPHLQETFKVTVRQDVQQDAAKLQIPTLLIYGNNDRATPPQYGEIFARLMPKNQLHILEDAGHFVHHDQPEKVAKLTKEFIS